MSQSYRHTQSGYLLVWAIIGPAVGLAAAGYSTQKALFLLIAALLGAVGLLFSSLTIEVTASELVWFFGPGLWRKRVQRREIASATPARNKWWWGWGVHLTPRGWLYNVDGLEAVEIALTDGGTFRLGSDEPAALAEALSRR